MNAKTYNQFVREVFVNGIPRSFFEQDPTTDPVREQQQAHQIMMRGLKESWLIECPCGCGLKGDICQAWASKRQAEHEEIPF